MISLKLSRIAAILGLVAIVGISVLNPPSARAQSARADILGTVTDVTGAVVPGADVVVRNVATGETRSMTTGSTGDYVFTALQVGSYSVSVSAPGFKKFNVPSLAIAAGDRARVDASMEAGAVDESVTVTGITPALQTDSSSSGDMLGTQSVQDLPLNGRNYVNLLQVMAGVNAGQSNSLQGGSRNTDQRQTGSYSANGMSDFFNNNMVDGQDNNSGGYIGVRPSVEGIEQVKILTNNYSADLGRAAGAVVNIITKSGGNEFHGSVFEYVRNDYFNAKNWFTAPGSPTPELRWNQFGGSIGGPIFRNKTFFFGDVEELRMIQSTPSLFSVPTAYEMNQFLTTGVGDFTDACPASLSATTCKARYYVATPNSVSAAYFNMYPHSGQIPGLFANNYSGTPKKQQNATVMDARVDHHISQNDLLFMRYAYNPTWTLNGSPFPPQKLPNVSQPFSAGLGGANGLSGTNTNTAQNAMVDYTHIFKPTLLWQMKAGYTRMDRQTVPLGYGMNIPSAFGMNNVNLPNVPGTSGMTQFSVAGLSGLGSAGYIPILTVYNVLQLNGAITWIRGSHTLKLGGAEIRRDDSLFSSAYATGIAVFFQLPSLASFFPHLAYGPAAMLAGQPLQIVRVNQMVKQNVFYWEPSLYVQDDWHARRNLTLNLGLRYEIYPPNSERHNQLSNFNLNTLSIDTPVNTNSKLGVSTGYANFSPRVGFALQLPHDAAVHGGFGMTFYPLSEGAGGAPIGAQNYPYVSSSTTSLNTSTFQFPSLTNMVVPTIGTPSGLAASQTTGVGSWPKNASTLYIEQFSIEAQKQFGANVATIGYVGELGRRFAWTYNADMPAPPGANNTTIPGLLYASQFPNLTTITVNTNQATMNYHAFRAMLQRRTASGLTYNINYTYAHGLTSTFSSNAFNGSAGIAGGFFANDPGFDYGNSDLDIRQRIAGSLTYALPFGDKFTGVKGIAFKGWQANTIAYWQTGLPFSVTDSYNFYLNGNTAVQTSQDLLPYKASFTGIGTPAERPNMVHSAKLSHPTVSQYFDVTAFQAHALGVVGNERRNQLYGPHDRRMDLSLFKTFPTTERIAVQFRAECFNLFNTPNFATPNSGISGWSSAQANGSITQGASPLYFGEAPVSGSVGSNNTFGSISSTATNEQPRTFQFALKTTF